MQWILNVIKSRGFLLGLGFTLLVVLVLVLGSWLDWSMTTRLLGVIGVLAVAVTVLVVNLVRANKAASAIEQSIKMQAQQQKQSTRPDRQEEIDELQGELERSIEMLKQSKVGGRRGRAALYALPWYMFIGPPAAGKTTAIANSGLSFPVGHNGVRGVGGTRNCDWFFSDQAILLDTAGRYMTEHEDTDEWLAFLDTLKKHRKERPINGVIIGISMAELAQAGPEEVEWHADNIRRRIDELIKRLGIRFPVYVLFTKCDLLHGFVEFFGELTRREREQIWGATFKRGEDEQGIRARFEREFERLYEVLTNMRSHRLARSMKREDRHKVFVFPMEFASMKDSLTLFVERLFQPNPYQESPIFRGFYFTSGTQEGVPIDRVIRAIADQAHLPASVGETQRDPEMETKSYFINDVFTDVVIPDQYLVRQSTGTRRRHRFLQAGVGAAAVVLLALFVLAAGQALVRSQVDLNQVEEAVAGVAPVRWEGGATMAGLAQMDALRGQIETLERREEDPPWGRLGLYRGGTVLAPARAAYLERARSFVDQYALPELQQRLRRPSGTSRLQGEARAELYDDLKAYLLLTSEPGRLEEESNRAALTAHLVDLVLERMPVLGSQEARPSVERQVEAYVQGLRREQVDPYVGDPALVTRVRNAIFQPPSVANLYASIKQQATDELPPFRLEDAVPSHYLSYFGARPEVPGFFTKEGWNSYVQAKMEEESRDPERTEWVMGYSTEDLPASMRDQDEVVSQLEELYFNEYAARWQQFLEQIRLRPAGDFRTIARQLSELGNQYDSPLLYVLAHVTEQTRFQNEAVANLRERVGERAERVGEARVQERTGVRGSMPDAPEAEMNAVERRFVALHQLKAHTATSGGADPALYKALESLSRVADVVGNLANAGNAEAAELAATVLDQNGGELATEIDAIDRALGRLDSDVRSRLFERPVIVAWSAILRAAQSHLNEQWTEQVYQPFAQRLDEVYPFANSVQTAALMDVESFFHPETGSVATFETEYLAPFVQRDGSPREWRGAGIDISSSARRAMEDIERISSGLFSGGTMRVDFELQPEVPDREGRAPAVGAVSITLHGTDNTYRMSSYRPWTQFSWPGRSGATLSLSTQEGTSTVAEYDGDWALVRLLQDAQMQRTSSGEYEVRWVYDYRGEGRIYVKYNLKALSATNLFDDPRGFFSLQLPETLD